MNQQTMRISFCTLVILLVGTAQLRAQDAVEFWDPVNRKDDTVAGTIESESPVGINVKLARGGTKLILAADVREVRYKCKVALADYRRPFGRERQALQAGQRDDQRIKLLEEALKGYREMLPNLQETPLAARYVQFKIAEVVARLGAENPERLAEAITLLSTFKEQHPTGWEIVAALKLLAQLQEGKGDLAAAGKTYAELAALKGIPTGTQRESQILGVRMLLRASKFAEAEKTLKSLNTTLSPGETAQSAVRVYLAETQLEQGNLGQVENEVKSALAATNDADVQAAGHNVLGDFYRLKGQSEDAFWEYLKVDVQYGQDREELAKALFHLAKLFDSVKNDRARAAECLSRLQDKAQFAGTAYHKKALTEKT